jgi:hypothetical protein
MQIVKGYRTRRPGRAPQYHLEQPPEGAEPLDIQLADGVRVSRSGTGELLLYSGDGPYGKRLDDALASGWCNIAGEAE